MVAKSEPATRGDSAGSAGGGVGAIFCNHSRIEALDGRRVNTGLGAAISSPSPTRAVGAATAPSSIA